MLDLRLIEDNYDKFKEKFKARKLNESVLRELHELHKKVKEETLKLEELQSVQNLKSKELGIKARVEGDRSALLDKLKKELEENKVKLQGVSAVVAELEGKLHDFASRIPNLIDDDVAIGDDENDNVEIKKVLEAKKFDFQPKEHWELAEKNGWLSFKDGAKLSGSRFTVLRGEGAKLSRALVNYMIDFNASRGFELVNVPFLVNSKTMYGTGNLPKFADDLYKVEDEDLWLIPTSEVPVTNLYADEIIDAKELPIKMTCYSACFRKEAGSAGKDTRGMLRQHQFEKVELVSITANDDSERVHQEMVDCASDLLASLGLAHRQMLLCSGDIGFGAAKTIDLEVWLPGQNKYREISSISNTRDFQARRAKIRYKKDGKNVLAHTLNGSSLAVGRALIAIMENYQTEDGSIEIPEVLRKYM